MVPMKTTRTLFNAGLAALATVGFLVPSGQAQLTIGTFGEWTGSEAGVWGPWSAATPTFGQTFTVNDPSATTLTTVRFKLKYDTGDPINFEAYVYRWMPVGYSGNVVGGRLNTAAGPQGIGTGVGFQTVEVPTGNVALTVGVQYMIFLSTVGYDDPLYSGEGVVWGYLDAGAQNEPQASAAGDFWFNFGDTEGNWSNSTDWSPHTSPLGTEDLAFEFVLVPEPETIGMVAALGLLGFGWMRRRAVK